MNILLYFLLLLLIIIIFFLFSKKNRKIYFPDKDRKIYFPDKKEIDQKLTLYLDKLSIIELKHKINNYHINSKEKLINEYKNRIGFFTSNEKTQLSLITNEINKRLNIDYSWFFVKFKNIEFNFPFTIDKYIFLPENIIQNLENNYRYRNLLVHEKLHIIQRFNQDKLV